MSPELERWLWDRIRFAGEEGSTPRELIAQMLADGRIKSEKQAWRTLEKWADGTSYDYGTSLDMGWRYRPETLPRGLRLSLHSLAEPEHG